LPCHVQGAARAYLWYLGINDNQSRCPSNTAAPQNYNVSLPTCRKRGYRSELPKDHLSLFNLRYTNDVVELCASDLQVARALRHGSSRWPSQTISVVAQNEAEDQKLHSLLRHKHKGVPDTLDHMPLAFGKAAGAQI